MIEFNSEIRNRIRASVAAYAYEFHNDSIMSDAEFDIICQSINPSVTTGNAELDEFFQTKFVAFSGTWIHQHPDLIGISRVYNLLRKDLYDNDLFSSRFG